MAWNNCYRPNGDDIRYQVWAGLAYGAKQYSYFCYHTPRANAAETYGPAIVDLEGKPTDLYEPVSELNWQIRAIGPTLMKLDTKVVKKLHTLCFCIETVEGKYQIYSKIFA